MMENKILGARETHRLVLTVKPETGKWVALLRNYNVPVNLKIKVKPETKFYGKC